MKSYVSQVTAGGICFEDLPARLFHYVYEFRIFKKQSQNLEGLYWGVQQKFSPKSEHSGWHWK